MILPMLSHKKRVAQFLYFIFLILGLSIYFYSHHRHDACLHGIIQELQHYQQHFFLKAACAFLLLRFLFASLAIPGGGLITLAGGAIFGWLPGSLLVLFANTTGYMIVFFLTRFAFKDCVEKRFQGSFQRIRQISNCHGPTLLFMLRMIEIVPSFVVNSYFALTDMKPRVYFFFTLLGAFPGIILFTHIGVQIATVRQLVDLVSIPVLISFGILAFLPVLSSFALQKTNGRHKHMLPFHK